MSSTHRTTPPTCVRRSDGLFWIEFADGRVVGAPESWFPGLERLSDERVEDCDLLSSDGVCWVDEDVVVDVRRLLDFTVPDQGRRT